MSKLMRVAGKDNSGKVKGVSISENGEIRVSDGASIVSVDSFDLAAGSLPKNHTRQVDKPCRVFIFVDSAVKEVPYEVTISSGLLDTAANYMVTDAPESFKIRNEILPKKIESNGDEALVSGNGHRSSAYTDLFNTVGNGLSYQVINKGATNLTGKVVLVSYPYSVVQHKEEDMAAEIVSGLSAVLREKPVIEPDYISTIAEFDGSKTQEDLYETDNHTVIEFLEFACTNTSTVRLYIYGKKSDGTLTETIGQLTIDTAKSAPYTVESSMAHNASLFDASISDTAGKLSLNRYLTFPNGVKITAGTLGVAAKVALRVYAIRG